MSRGDVHDRITYAFVVVPVHVPNGGEEDDASLHVLLMRCLFVWRSSRQTVRITNSRHANGALLQFCKWAR
jgi:hypothetical protein